jgi:hypothetical protein
MERPEPEVMSLQRAARPSPQPGTIEESDAIAMIDQARYEEMYPQSKRRQRARLRRHWSDREHALGH